MTLAELLALLARWSELDADERTALNDGLAVFVAGCEDADELTQLDEALVGITDEILDGDGNPSDEDLEALQWIAPVATAVRERGVELDTAVADRAAEAARLAEAIRGPQATDGDPDAGDADAAGGDGDADADADAPGDGDADADADVPADGAAAEPVAAAGSPAPRRTSLGRVRRPAAVVATANADRPAPIVATAMTNVPGVAAGAQLATNDEIGAAMLATWESMSGLSLQPGMRVPVLRRQVNLEQLNPERWLTLGDTRTNMARIHAATAPEAIAAAGGFCAAFPVNYDVPGIGVADRPVREALVRFGVDRGGVRLQSPPVLDDLEGAITIWTAENDANPGSDGPSSKPCLVVDCGDDYTAKVHAIVQCLEFKNFSARTFPEYQDRYLQLAAIAQARKAEVKLLQQIGAGSTQVSVGEGLSATRDILTGIDRIVAARRSRYRLGDAVPLRRLAPMWERGLIRADLARELPGSTAERLAVADAQIDEFFRVRNIMNTYVLDGEAGQMFGPQGDGPATGWPGSIISYMFPEGSWLFLDGGELQQGVVRDSVQNAANKFQMWGETWEGTAFVGIFSDRIVHDVCPSGTTSGTVDFDPCFTGS